MVVVRNTSKRAIKIKELGKTIPVSDNNYVIPEYIYEKYKGQLSLLNMLLDSDDTNKMFSKTEINGDGEAVRVDVESQLDEIVRIGNVEYTIAPLANE